MAGAADSTLSTVRNKVALCSTSKSITKEGIEIIEVGLVSQTGGIHSPGPQTRRDSVQSQIYKLLGET